LQQNEDFLIQIKLDKAEDLTTAHIDGEWRLMELLSSYRALIIKVFYLSEQIHVVGMLFVLKLLVVL